MNPGLSDATAFRLARLEEVRENFFALAEFPGLCPELEPVRRRLTDLE
jgi:hypothetical protein